jgi:2-polyprenyl-6-methoxyphenol hydroxylase-like FAD-dependent oxidoreductase
VVQVNDNSIELFTNKLIYSPIPVGLLTSHALLSKTSHLYDVEVYEARDSPFLEVQGPRSYSLGLNIRGQTAIKHFDINGRSLGLYEAISQHGVLSESFYLHIGKLKLQIRKPNNNKNASAPPPTLMISRSKLVGGLVQSGIQCYGDRFKIKYNTKAIDIDLLQKKIYFSDGSVKDYDLLIGADGVNSQVRKSMENQLAIKVEETILPGQYKVMQAKLPPTLEADSIHAMECTNKEKSNIGLFLIPSPQNETCVLINWRNASNVPSYFPDTTDSDITRIQDTIEKDFPLFGRPSKESVEILQKQTPSVALTIRANSYASPNNGVMMLGDAAHSTGGTLGQGANSGLLDVVNLGTNNYSLTRGFTHLLAFVLQLTQIQYYKKIMIILSNR